MLARTPAFEPSRLANALHLSCNSATVSPTGTIRNSRAARWCSIASRLGRPSPSVIASFMASLIASVRSSIIILPNSADVPLRAQVDPHGSAPHEYGLLLLQRSLD